MAETFQNYIGGQWVDAASGATFESRNPARTSDLVGQLPPQSGPRETWLAAVEAAKEAFDPLAVDAGTQARRDLEARGRPDDRAQV